MEKDILIEGGEALLDLGVSLPFKEFKIPFRQKKIKWRVTLRRPCLGNMIRIAILHLKTGVTFEQIEKFTPDEHMWYLKEHGKKLSRMIALTICRGAISGFLFSRLVAWFLREFVLPDYLFAALMHYIRFLGIKPFTNFIRWTERTNPLRPRLSHKRKGS